MNTYDQMWTKPLYPREVVIGLSRGQWADRIRSAWQSSVAGIIECGRLLIEAKAELPHGEFEAMVEADLPFEASSAQRVMKISRDTRLTNPAHVQLLPPSWGTLYALTTLDDAQFAKAIDGGVIKPEMKRSDVSNLKRLLAREIINIEAEPGCTVEDLGSLVKSGRKFSVIYADPPWSFKVYSGKGKQRSAERHYDTQSLDDIKAMSKFVEPLAADDCALLMWAVMPELPGALAVIESWGFTYKTAAFTWIKENRSGDGLFWGMGYWTRANAELCLLATKGSPQRQAKDVHQVIKTPVGEHSRKPDEAQVRIERLLPGPYLELYGRRATPNWTVWGNGVTRSLFHQSIPEFAA